MEYPYGVLYFDIHKCDPSLESETGIICQDEATIDSFIKGNLSQYFYSYAGINPMNYESPFTITSRIDYMAVDPAYHKEARLLLKEVEMETDDGWLLESKASETRMTVESALFDFDFMLEWGVASISI